MLKKSYVVLMAVLLLLFVSIPVSSCSRTGEIVDPLARTQKYMAPPTSIPYIPPSYYECIAVLPIDVQNAYYSSYGNHAEAEFLYNGKAFAFKDVLVDAWMIRDIDKGWIWADLCKCPIVNLADAKKFTPGDRIDIVGICMGRNLAESPGLVFRDCYVMQAGSVQLPAPGSAGNFVAGY
jgi:hypothetical protein